MFADKDSQEHKNLVDIATRIEEIVKDTNIFLKPVEKRGAVVDFAQKIEDMIANIKDILAKEPEKRDLSDLKEKLESIMDMGLLKKKLESIIHIYKEVKAFGTIAKDLYHLALDIKGMFADKDSQEHKNLVDIATRIEEIIRDTNIFLQPVKDEAAVKTSEKRGAVVDWAQKIEDMISNIKEILANKPEKRDLGKMQSLMKKLKRALQVALEVKSLVTVAKDVYDLIVDIKGMYADEDSVEHKELLDVAKDIGKIAKDTLSLIPAIKNEFGKRASWDDVIVPEVAEKVSRRYIQ